MAIGCDTQIMGWAAAALPGYEQGHMFHGLFAMDRGTYLLREGALCNVRAIMARRHF